MSRCSATSCSMVSWRICCSAWWEARWPISRRLSQIHRASRVSSNNTHPVNPSQLQGAARRSVENRRAPIGPGSGRWPRPPSQTPNANIPIRRQRRHRAKNKKVRLKAASCQMNEQRRCQHLADCDDMPRRQCSRRSATPDRGATGRSIPPASRPSPASAAADRWARRAGEISDAAAMAASHSKAMSQANIRSVCL